MAGLRTVLAREKSASEDLLERYAGVTNCATTGHFRKLLDEGNFMDVREERD